MSVLGVSNAAIGAYQYTEKCCKWSKFYRTTAQTQEVSDAEKLENFKKEI